MTTVLSATPIIPARNLTATTRWYRDALGFTVKHVEAEYGIVERDAVEVHFWGPSGIEPQHSMTMYRLGVRGIDSLYGVCKEAGIVHPNAPLDRKEWGAMEFAVGDCDGNLLTFFERTHLIASAKRRGCLWGGATGEAGRKDAGAKGGA